MSVLKNMLENPKFMQFDYSTCGCHKKATKFYYVIFIGKYYTIKIICI